MSSRLATQRKNFPGNRAHVLNSLPQPVLRNRACRQASHMQCRGSQGNNGKYASEGASQHREEETYDTEADDLLQPNEDWTVPGGYQDSLSKNTKLGRAVDDACSELSHLGELEKDSLMKANELLRKLGYKGDITNSQNSSEQKPGD